jgi:hypothetical protein
MNTSLLGTMAVQNCHLKINQPLQRFPTLGLALGTRRSILRNVSYIINDEIAQPILLQFFGELKGCFA